MKFSYQHESSTNNEGSIAHRREDQVTHASHRAMTTPHHRKFGYEGFTAEVSINDCPHNSSSDTQNATSRILRLPRQRRFETVDQFFPHCLYHGMRGWVFIRFEGSLPPCTLHGGTPRAAPQAFRFPDPHTACFTLGRGSLANPRLSSEPDECIEALKRGE